MLELRFPELPVGRDPIERAAHWIGGERGSSHASVSLDGCESGPLEHAHVLGHGRQRHVEAAGELADRPVAGCETGEDLAPCGIGERGEGRVQVGVNHMV